MSTRATRLLLLASALVVAGLAPVGRAAPEPPSCAWAFQLDRTLVNTLYPDEGAAYWVTVLPAVPGAELELRGDFPFARYMSFTSYNAALQSADGIADIRIAPEPGGVNPFRAGVRRDRRPREYAVRVVFGQRPEQPAPNTLYTTNTEGTKTGVGFVVAYRVYRPDRGLDDAGGVALPKVRYLLPGAPPIDLPTCPYPGPLRSSANDVVADLSVPWAEGTPAIGTDPPRWRRFYNGAVAATHLTDNDISGDALSSGLQPLTTALPQGGFLDNPDNAYVYTSLGAGRGELAVVEGRMPTVARTFPAAPTMPVAQLRYWSLCSYDVVSQRYYSCVIDDELPLRAQGRFTVVVSSSDRRPPNARVDCGVAYLPAGPLPSTLLILRNMLPASGFTAAIQHAKHGDEATTMGEYLPTVRYGTVADAEASGCRG